ncbi:hypothetical protein [Variovorax paradoxus]|uniref:Uncharacterized protein n=1 Tax=Variovorax paradoxus TaxID=34073 RepID=A0A0H2MA43_VARPD|nr:hypothetical protein [Variovorax paradoxus]KLN57532.1 hypothetical protein VPARA_16130 [Variovorax paradoxus]
MLRPPGPISPSATAIRPGAAWVAAAITGPPPSLPHPDEAQLLLLRDGVQQRPQLAANNAEDFAHLRRGKQAHRACAPLICRAMRQSSAMKLAALALSRRVDGSGRSGKDSHHVGGHRR